VVDDNSPDGTANAVRTFTGKYSDRLFLGSKDRISLGWGTGLHTLGFKWAIDKKI